MRFVIFAYFQCCWAVYIAVGVRILLPLTNYHIGLSHTQDLGLAWS